MITDATCRVSWRAVPRSFVALMSLYESNYIRLGWLIGDLRALQGEHVSRVVGDCELTLRVLEHGPYTSMLQLTYPFDRLGLGADTPDLAVRVYHDARVVEAHGFGSGGTGCGGSGGESLSARWSRNMLLNKWLEYCVARGHRFCSAGSVS
jgi:hypothetical protein